MSIGDDLEVAVQPTIVESLDGRSCARTRQADPVTLGSPGRHQVRLFERMTGRANIAQRARRCEFHPSMRLKHERVHRVRGDLAVLAEVHAPTTGSLAGLQKLPLPLPAQVVQARDAANPALVRDLVVALKPCYRQPFLFHVRESTQALPKKVS